MHILRPCNIYRKHRESWIRETQQKQSKSEAVRQQKFTPMELPIPSEVRKIWDSWNLRSCILLSLSVQVFLMLFVSFRKRCKSSVLLIFIWLAYLLADWIAAVAIGLITKSQGDHCEPEGNEDLLAFWASFLLLHLGGPDSITSFSLEDNEFWLRHLMGLILQVLAAAYSFYLTLPKNKLWIPTSLVLVVGTIKFAERTFALYLASLDHFAETVLPEPNPGPDYEEAVAIFSSMRSVQVQTQAQTTKMQNVGVAKDSADGNVILSESLDDMKLLQAAYSLFESFKGLIVGFLLSSKERESSRNFFLSRSPCGAFRLIEYELSFMYQVLHTKVVVVRRRFGYILRFISFLFIVGASTLFYVVEKRGFKKFDTILTYALLAGAVILDIISVFDLIFSEWTLIVPQNRLQKYIAPLTLKRRIWSQKVSKYNMISYCLDERPTCVYELASYLRFRGILDRLKIWLFSSSENVTTELKVFIFNELRAKSLAADTVRAASEACSQRGDWALLQTSNYMKLKWSIGEFQYAESLLLWHIATELCYHQNTKPGKVNSTAESKSKEICKLLSDYMFYLLVMQPTMLAPVLGNWHIVFQDSCAEAKRFCVKHSLSRHPDACKGIFSVKSKFRPAAVKGSKSKSVLFDACILAQQLRNLDADEWHLTSRVWVELLSYAAINCRPIVHAQQTSRGGELLTFTWLLMNHLGLGTLFYEQEQKDGTKLVATK